jgi:hypothetical protein
MTHITKPDPNRNYLRTPGAYQSLVDTFSTTLPPLLDASPEALHRRNEAAIAQVAALSPANASEAMLAVQYVVAGAQAMECLRRANLPDTDRVLALKFNAQSANMMSVSRAALNTLLHTQAIRAKRDAHPINAGKAAWAEHMAAKFMNEALTNARPGHKLSQGDKAPSAGGVGWNIGSNLIH